MNRKQALTNYMRLSAPFLIWNGSNRRRMKAYLWLRKAYDKPSKIYRHPSGYVKLRKELERAYRKSVWNKALFIPPHPHKIAARIQSI